MKPFPILLLNALLIVTLVRAQGVDGLYSTDDTNYRIEVKFAPGKLQVIEPNKTSVYTQRPGTPVYDFTNPTNGIAYILEVMPGGRGLKAYKPGREDNYTPLALIRAAEPPPAPEPAPSSAAVVAPAPARPMPVAPAPAPRVTGLQRIPVQNVTALNPDLEELWGRHDVPGVKVAGRYAIDGAEHPATILNADGTGTFEMYGAPNPDHVYGIRWWIQANADGTVIGKDYPLAAMHWLVIEYVDKPYQGKRFERISLSVQKDPAGGLFIFDRRKAKTDE